MSLPRHDPPGYVNDLTDEHKQAWSNTIGSFMLTENVSSIMTPQFYDATKVVEKNPQSPSKITWVVFPKKVKLDFSSDIARWTKADSARSFQDEYLEWIVFCNEGPEYFEFLAQYQRNTLLDLYRSLNPGFNILEEDLFVDNVYNPLNKWNSSTNTGTMMHLIQVNNTLGAEVDLGARATVQRKRPDGTLITDSDELIQCSKYGNPNRNSDPTIGAGINAAARNQVMLTIQNPVGLYIDSINWNLIEPPAGHNEDDPSTFWKWTRGRTGNYMHGEFEVPEGKGYVLGDLKVNKKTARVWWAVGRYNSFIALIISPKAYLSLLTK
ncbi:hypothetical protein BDP27DRAFT_1453694 [Rhodocollybia butyracea]|uniref:Uncharacterized protein n=1 Tax=Rhodocollybia butyracea TaxID=206335 RepID=A0A9P5TY54_9AGAR|nr:hypothetical protein BDP27DRAFT_1453694 [Rhodocollybia butyracea]